MTGGIVMKCLLKLSIPFLLVIMVAGCSSGKLSKIEQTNEQQQQYIKELMEIADRDAAKIKETESELGQINQRLADIENRINISQTDETATVQEIKETVAFLSDQLSRLDKSIQTQRPTRPLPKGADVFKPGGFDVSSSYNAALSDYKEKLYEAAISGFKEVLTVSPTSSLADNAQYWIGECYDAMGNYEMAQDAFNKVFDYPESNKLPDARVKIGLIYTKLGKTDLAREEFKAVIDNYPDTNAASIATSQLRKLGE